MGFIQKSAFGAEKRISGLWVSKRDVFYRYTIGKGFSGKHNFSIKGADVLALRARRKIPAA